MFRVYNMLRQKGIIVLCCVVTLAASVASRSTPRLPWADFLPKSDDIDIRTRGLYGPFSPQLGSAQSGFPDSEVIPDFIDNKVQSRTGRAAVVSPNVKSLYSTLNVAPGKQEITEPDSTDNAGSAAIPKQYLPSIYGLFGPLPDPSMFAAKKSVLDALFKNIATTTTAAPIPKSTIVPPGFWIPASVSVDPTAYNQKVAEFLAKLFDSLKLNKTAIEKSETAELSDVVPTKIKRSVQDLSAVNAAKDTIVDTILAELGDLKTDMLTTINDLIAYQKAVSAQTTSGKPFKPFGPSMWMKATADPLLPFRQRILTLSKVFDMLTNLQRNITAGIETAVKANINTSDEYEPTNNGDIPLEYNTFSPNEEYDSGVNTTLLDAIKQRIAAATLINPMIYSPSGIKPISGKYARSLPKGPTSFWVSYPQGSADAKRDVSNSNSHFKDQENYPNQQYKRAVSMQMHQGYQSLPPGSIESVQAGGGSALGHEGGGIKLYGTNEYADINKWSDWMQYFGNEHQNHRHHNHH